MDSHQKTQAEEDKKRFLTKSPLMTLLTLSLGPLSLTVGQAIHDALDLFLISVKYGGEAVFIVGTATFFRFLLATISNLFADSVIAKVSRTLSENHVEVSLPIIVDMYRLSFIVVAIFSIIFYFVSEFLLGYLGLPKELMPQAISYLIPILVSYPILSFVPITCGILQGQGRSYWNGLFQGSSFILNVVILSPLILFGFDAPLKVASFGFIFAQFIVLVILFYLIFAGKMGIQPRLKGFIEGFTFETFPTLLYGLPTMLVVFANSVASFLHFSWTVQASDSQAGQVGQILSAFIKIQAFVLSIPLGFFEGFLTAGTFHYGMKLIDRMFKLLFWTVFIIAIYSVVCMIVFIPGGGHISKIWVDDSVPVQMSLEYIRIPFYTAVLYCLNELFTIIMVSINKQVFAIIIPFLRAIVGALFCVLFYFTGKDQSLRMMYVYNTNDIGYFLIGMGFLIPCFVSIMKSKDQIEPLLDDDDEYSQENESSQSKPISED